MGWAWAWAWVRVRVWVWVWVWVADTDGDGDVSFTEFATYAASCEQLEAADLVDVLTAVMTVPS